MLCDATPIYQFNRTEYVYLRKWFFSLSRMDYGFLKGRSSPKFFEEEEMALRIICSWCGKIVFGAPWRTRYNFTARFCSESHKDEYELAQETKIDGQNKDTLGEIDLYNGRSIFKKGDDP